MTKVLKAFQDKTDGIIYYAGDDYASERVEELAEAGFLEAEAEEKPKQASRKKTTDNTEE
ncbi:hypothetical protein KK059_005885 [Streptococcus salivarius]|uniref:hypothetical protein n=1 Tax=Streptococcus salivarius TaxID=1304 RepID=UPI001BDE0830|nr:hypothetical protein [Streptococcus salivarius]MBT2136229.1 hypothetical protein [Streptococcus salivarius]